MIGGPAAGATPFERLRLSAGMPAASASASDIAFLPTSSGTTGLPKSVVLTHRNLVASLCQMRLAHRVTEAYVVIAALPLFHIYGLQVTLNLALLEGATVVILPRFELETFLRTVQDHGVTRAEVVPPMVLGLATSDPAPLLQRLVQPLSRGASISGGQRGRPPACRSGCPSCDEHFARRGKQIAWSPGTPGGCSHNCPP